MLLLVGTVLGLLVAGSAFLIVRGFVGLFRRRAKSVMTALGGVALSAVTVVLLSLAAYRIGTTGHGSALEDAAAKASILARNISTLMNLSALGLPLGAFVALAVELRTRRRS
jgi:hypothetical protein